MPRFASFPLRLGFLPSDSAKKKPGLLFSCVLHGINVLSGKNTYRYCPISGYDKENDMNRKIIAVNAGPRKGWNTDTLITKASEGAESSGASVERFDLFSLQRYTGCISCFGCKKEKNKGRCICRDALTPILDSVRDSDGLIIGSPNYLGNLTASFRAFYERLIFQNLTYSREDPCCTQRRIPVLLIMTSNASDTAYTALLENYRQTLDRFIGPTAVFVSGDTLQLKNYEATDWPWSLFDPEAKKIRHETIFPAECEKVYRLGAEWFL